jgi:HAD superfamily hydrolase (TIGR01509 family)
MNVPDAFIFDFNGVLFWDTHFHDDAWRQYSKRLRGSQLTDDEMIHKVHGRTNKDVLEYLLQAPLSKEELKQHTETKESIYRQLCLSHRDQFVLSPGAIELLGYLNQNSIPHTIATSSELGNVQFFFQYLDLAKWFEFELVTYDDGSMNGKPAPDLYLRAAEKMKVKPEDSLVVEDSRSGVASAHNAGVGQIVAIGPKENHLTLKELEGVTMVISDFHELLNIISS